MDQTTVRQRRGGIKTFLNLKRLFAFILFYYLHNYFKYMSIILSSINRVACNDIFKGEQPSDRVGPVPPGIYAYEYYLNEIECIPVESFTVFN